MRLSQKDSLIFFELAIHKSMPETSHEQKLTQRDNDHWQFPADKESVLSAKKKTYKSDPSLGAKFYSQGANDPSFRADDASIRAGTDSRSTKPSFPQAKNNVLRF